MQVRPVRPQDLDQIHRLDLLCRLSSWPLTHYRWALQDPAIDFRLAWEADQGVGFFLSRILAGEMELLKLGVEPSWQGRGLGRHLLHLALQQGLCQGARNCYLEVREGNRRAVEFYLRNGFQLLCVRKGYYREPREDALVLRRSLAEADE